MLFLYRIVVLNVLSKKENGGKPASLGDVHIPLIEYTPDMWGTRKSFNLKDLVSFKRYNIITLILERNV